MRSPRPRLTPRAISRSSQRTRACICSVSTARARLISKRLRRIRRMWTFRSTTSPKTVSGVTTEASALRIKTEQQEMRVSQTFFINNISNPPRTQFSDHSYEIYLPPGAKVDASAALGPGGTPVQASPVPLADKNHYAFAFPLRPGETAFQLEYHLPYSGSLALIRG